MEQLSDKEPTKAAVIAIADELSQLKAENTVALDVARHSSFADFFIISTARSQAHLGGLYRRAHELLDAAGLPPRQSVKRSTESGWILLDCGSVIVHLMLKDQRAFYDLERLWFDADRIYPPTDSAESAESGQIAPPEAPH